MQENRNYRIRTDIGSDAPVVLNVALDNTYEELEILSLKLTDKNAYKLYDCGYGVIVGRVLANGNYGVPNAKISVFVETDGSESEKNLERLYNFTSSFQSYSSSDSQYNLLPDFVDKVCHQDVGTFKSKRAILDNNDVIEIFDKYYRYTTTTNEAGDYMLYGVPTGQQIVHMDVDLSDIGILSQTPRDMMYQGYSIDLFESPTMFKKSDNLNELVQIKRSDKSIFVEPFWGDTTESSNPNNASINRLDFNIDYTFKPTCIFMGSVVSDRGNEYINRNCKPTKKIGTLSDFGTGGGLIEMIRQTPNGGVEQATIKGKKLIDDNGVWCYQIPMNLDYMMTDEFGNNVPTDDPEKGIATRARVRFRISMDDLGGEQSTTKRARYLVPNNPEVYFNDEERDEKIKKSYEFGSYTNDEDFRDLFWNCVYTVKSYIPRLQKTKSPSTFNFTGIKAVNRPGDNNPMPYNSLSFKLGFRYRFLCFLSKLFIRVIYNLNIMLVGIGALFQILAHATAVLADVIYVTSLPFVPIGIGVPMLWLAKGLCACLRNPNDDDDMPSDADTGNTNWWRDMKVCIVGSLPEDEETAKKSLCGLFYLVYMKIGAGIGINGMCEDSDIEYHPGVNTERIESWLKTEEAQRNGRNENNTSNDISKLFDCIENSLVQDNEVSSFNFVDDWVNGVLYFPLWFRFVRPKQKLFFNFLTLKERDRWCDNDSEIRYRQLKLYKTCSLDKNINQDGSISPYDAEFFPNPLYDRYYQIPNKIYENIVIGYAPSDFDKTNCYGYKCHKKMVSYVSGLPGVVKRMETIKGENVYYYVPGDVEKLKVGSNEVEQYVKMFSTDIVLLGSLHSCDMQGIPQFFKNLQPTTYNMPPDLLVTDGEIDDSKDGKIYDGEYGGDNEVFITKTDYTYETGSDWGSKAGPRQCMGWDNTAENINNVKEQWNLENVSVTQGKSSSEKYADGGLFYGITCSNVFTKPKTCVNLERICEYGVNGDIAKYIKTENSEHILIPDGYISYDEIYDNDGRSAFATMNSNNLSTLTNPNTGFPVYDFTNLYVDNFDGTASKLMGNMNCKCRFEPYGGANLEYGNYFYNDRLEYNSPSYTRFRYGTHPVVLGKSVGKNALSNGNIEINTTNGFISTKNSYYFYFGLKSGKTAVERFMTDYFSVCETEESENGKYSFDYKANSWCGNGHDGYLSIYLNRIDTPYSIEFSPLNNSLHYLYIDNLSDEKIYFGECSDCSNNGYVQMIENNIPVYLENDVYNITIYDANGNETVFTVNFTDRQILADVFAFPNASQNDFVYALSPTYDDVANDNSRYPNQGGYLKIYRPYFSDNSPCNYYKIEVRPHNPSDFPDSYGTYEGVSFDCGTPVAEVDPSIPVNSNLWGIGSDEIGDYYVVGVPKNVTNYDVIITELCCENEICEDCSESENVTVTNVYVGDAVELKMLVNGIDYDIISYFNGGYDFGNQITFDPNNVTGWDNMADIGVYTEPEDIDWTSGNDVWQYVNSIMGITTSNYNWNEAQIISCDMLIPGSVRVPNTAIIGINSNSPEYVFSSSTLLFYHLEQNQQHQWVYVYLPYPDYYDDVNRTQEEKDSIRDNIISVINSRKELSKNIRAAFTMGEGEYDITIGYSGGYGLIKHSISYQYEYNNLLGASSLNETVERRIDNQTIPTLYFGNYNTPIYSTRQPYLNAVTDSLLHSMPLSFDGTTIFNTPQSLDRNNMFQAHMLNKGLAYNYEIWSPFQNYPLYGNSIQEDTFVSWEGFIAMELENGISTSLKFQNANFDVQRTYPFDKPFNIVSLNEGSFTDTHIPESKYVIERYLQLGYGESSSCFTSYKVKSSINDNRQFLPFTEPTDEIDINNVVINDGLTEANINLYPNYRIILNEEESFVCSEKDYIANSNNGYFIISLMFEGYNPDKVVFYDDEMAFNVTYPSYENGPFDANTSIYRWGYIQTLDSTANLYGDGQILYDATVANSGNNYMFKGLINTNVYQQNHGTTYGVSITTKGNGICYGLTPRYALHIWDGTFTFDSGSNKTRIVANVSNTLNDTHCRSYIMHYPFDIDVYKIETIGETYVFSETQPKFPSFSINNSVDVVLNTIGDYTSGYNIYIRDVTGLRHKLN